MKARMYIPLAALTFAISGLTARSNAAATYQCEPNQPKLFVITASIAVADANYSNRAKVVRIVGLRYEPETITVNAGQTITWINETNGNHTVTLDPAEAKNKNDVSLPPGAQTFDSGIIGPGKTFSHTFTIPGVYKYFCKEGESEGMKGMVIVRPVMK
jgi:plastocyanin